VGGLVDPARCSCAAVFGEVVDLALRENVDAVAISGDVVDKENKFHEAYGPVERGLRRLATAGIEVFAVAGNHDFDVLPRLINEVGSERFHLLGRGGTWERAQLIRDGAPALQIIGWSFPSEHVTDCPLRSFRPDADRAEPHVGPVLGLLHADLDQPQSCYAPVLLRELQATPVTMWLLGHIHRPLWVPRRGTAAVLYPGSPQAMDPGETGRHGPWLVTIDGAGEVSAEQVPLALVRYEYLELDMTGVDTKEAFDAFMPRQLRERLQQACRDCGPVELCSVRIRLTGQTRLHGQLRVHCEEVRQQLDLMIDRFRVRVDEVVVDTRPPVDLARLSSGSSVVAELARVLAHVQGPEAAAGVTLEGAQSGDSVDLKQGFMADRDLQPLLASLASAVDGVCGARVYQPLPAAMSAAPGPATIREMLCRQGMLLLDALIAQRDTASTDGAQVAAGD
jgi:DNA repair exonuclease SbcCD nuclease subunit